MSTKNVKIRHPAGVIDLGDGLEVDVTLGRHALGSLLHARSPLLAAGKDGREVVGSATLLTYDTQPDGSAVDLEFQLEFPDPEPDPPKLERDFIRADGIRETWACELPPEGAPYTVVREEWSGDGQRRIIHEIRLR